MVVRPALPLNAQSPIVANCEFSGMMNEVRPVPQNASFPIEVTLAGRVNEVRLLQFLKAVLPIDTS